MSSATNSPAITGVSNPNPQMLPGGTPPPMSSQYPGDPISGGGTPGLPTGTGIPMPTGKGGGPSVPTTPAPPPRGGLRGPGDIRSQPTPLPSPWMGQLDPSKLISGMQLIPGMQGEYDPGEVWTSGMTSGAKPLQGMRANFPPGLPTKRPDVRTGPGSKYPPGALTRPPAIPMRDPTMPSPSTGYSIPFGKRRRGLV